ncbi:MAG: family 10 glycosylhydrolase [Acidobacteriota bacterium]|nr:family 10 glycosylhydrolase [Acidobacteriota bacterium]
MMKKERALFNGLVRDILQVGSIRNLTCVALVAALLGTAFMPVSARSGQEVQRRREVHALWAHPPDVGRTPEEVRRFVERCKRAGIDTVVLLVKGINGELYWKSKRFPQAIAKGWESFDLLEHFTREAHAQGIKVDAWLVDFVEGANNAAFREHPEWAQLNPEGGTTLTEKLGQTRSYPYVWMCPARRPGYTDQWLLPMFEEVARYGVDSVHHDYVRYPGDVAPDSYCFCDYCLQHIPRYAMLSYETRADERYRVRQAQPRIEANWWSDPTILPAGWQERDRREKANFLLNGRTIPLGPPDMRYFFYDYRVHQIDKFVREVAERVRRINPKTEISVAVFKNPILSGRYIGQHWSEWTPWVDIFMPMTYRSHFAGSFESYLDHLTETTARQLEWIGREQPLYAGIASTYLYREEMQPFDEIRDRVGDLKSLPPIETAARQEGAIIIDADVEREQAARAAKRAEIARSISAAFAAMSKRLAEVAPGREREIRALVAAATLDGGSGATNESLDRLAKAVGDLRLDLPPGFLPPEKLVRSIEAARKANPDGIAIFAAGSLTREKLWDALGAAFKD